MNDVWKDTLGDIVESLKYQVKEFGLHVAEKHWKFLSKKSHVVKCSLVWGMSDKEES